MIELSTVSSSSRRIVHWITTPFRFLWKPFFGRWDDPRLKPGYYADKEKK